MRSPPPAAVSLAEDLTAASVTVDTPVPFKASDLLRLIDEAMGKLDNPDSSAPYLRLITRFGVSPP